jgi:hypothetical protein
VGPWIREELATSPVASREAISAYPMHALSSRTIAPSQEVGMVK